ncbi:VPLPA-CTERM sorting domain-containing protein [Pseudotabrizicola sp.]|uniref:VPLPA-CTERM sorting domain-containing protein n=1 Tax=Pseudotabrizicola sp. TaxID=2939647 RepID=UPI00351EF10D
MNLDIKTYAMGALAGLAMALAATTATAATCSSLVLTGVTPASDCYVGEAGIGGSGNDSAALLNSVMPSGLFGLTGWELIARDNDLNGTDTGDASALTVSGSLTSGFLTLAASLYSTYSDIVIVLKAGGGFDPEFWVAYKAVAGTTSFEYASIFTKLNGAGKTVTGEISHISVYGVPGDTPSPVPLPAAGWLMIAGLGGLAALRRRKRA